MKANAGALFHIRLAVAARAGSGNDGYARITEPALFLTYLPFGFGVGASLVSLGEG